MYYFGIAIKLVRERDLCPGIPSTYPMKIKRKYYIPFYLHAQYGKLNRAPKLDHAKKQSFVGLVTSVRDSFGDFLICFSNICYLILQRGHKSYTSNCPDMFDVIIQFTLNALEFKLKKQQIFFLWKTNINQMHSLFNFYNVYNKKHLKEQSHKKHMHVLQKLNTCFSRRFILSGMLHLRSRRPTFIICGQSFLEFLLSQLVFVSLSFLAMCLTQLQTPILPLEKRCARFLTKRGGRTGRVNIGLHKLKARDAGEGP